MKCDRLSKKQKHCLPKELVAGNWWIAFLAQLSHALLRHYLTANLMGVTEISQDLICIFITDFLNNNPHIMKKYVDWMFNKEVGNDSN